MALITVITAASSRALTTVAAVMAELGPEWAGQEQLIAGYIAEASEIIEGQCNRIFALERLLQVDRELADQKTMLLGRWPVVSVLQVSRNGAGLDAATYEVNNTAGTIRPLAGESYCRFPAGRHEVDFWAGYRLPEQSTIGLPTEGVQPLPAVIGQACIRMVKGRVLGRERDPALKAQEVEGVGRDEYWVGGPAIPEDIADALAPFRMPAI
ncbi:MAG: hypothetical protein KBC46_03455 [Ferrovibrio sp.]|nr:hypothetical protein [Ferrovibrio sp.]